jgi:hypothetical protein
VRAQSRCFEGGLETDRGCRRLRVGLVAGDCAPCSHQSGGRSSAGCSSIRCAMNSTCEPLPVAQQNFQSSRAARVVLVDRLVDGVHVDLAGVGLPTVLATCPTSLRRSSRAPAAHSSSRSASERRPASGSDARCGRPTEAPLRPDAWRPVHRHDIAVCELAIGGSSSTVAVATNQTRQRSESADHPGRADLSFAS